MRQLIDVKKVKSEQNTVEKLVIPPDNVLVFIDIIN
jgi:hypothetical protein